MSGPNLLFAPALSRVNTRWKVHVERLIKKRETGTRNSTDL